ncbi:MAG: DUF2273 domain-containing protein [Limnochordia bacterium]|jgi:uncharacterized membrane protein|nr:DUF2273 domain-containing protein [Limnochordia bacterium]MDD2630390.1 DUF2273 domain-containing protein [Limnochordia bacterium]MDD4518437.1 DUF2273 domain-containing protein [Limnochordia bacterium]
MQGHFREVLILFLANKGKVLGAILGLVTGLLFLRYGFFRTLLVLLCIAIGYVIGRRLDSGQEFTDFLDRLLHSQDRN